MKTKIEDSTIKLKPDDEKLIVVKIVDKFNQFEEERLSQLNDIKSIRNAIYDATIPKINAWESKIQLPEIYELAQTLKSHLTQNLYSHPDAMFDVSGTTPETQALANKQKAMLVNTFEEMKIHEEIEKIIDSIVETGEATIFVGWCTKIKQYRKALPFLNKSDTSTNNFIIEEKVIYDNAKIKHIKAEDFVFDKTNVNNWDECAKIYRSYSSIDEIATDNANNYLTNEKLEELKGVMAKNNTENKNLTNNKIEILEFWGDIELSDGKVLKNRIITIAGGREIIRFEENPFVINPFIHANILENPSTLRGISPLRVALILNNISSSILNKQLDALSLMINPPYLAPKGCFNGLQAVKPGKIIEYDSALMPTPPTQISFEKAMQGWDFLNYFKNTIESSTGIFKNMAGNLQTVQRTATELNYSVNGQEARLNMILDAINRKIIIPMVEKTAEIISNFKLGKETIRIKDHGKTVFTEIDDTVRNSAYIYRYGDRKATFERKMRMKELFEVFKAFAQVPEVEEQIDWMECFKFALEQYGIENSNNFLTQK